MAIKCPKCSVVVPENTRFCTECGSGINGYKRGLSTSALAIAAINLPVSLILIVLFLPGGNGIGFCGIIVALIDIVIAIMALIKEPRARMLAWIAVTISGTPVLVALLALAGIH